MEFGEFVKVQRLGVGLSLRKFCDIAQLDASNWSKTERGILTLSMTMERLEELAGILELKRNSVGWVTFFDLAALAKGKIPENIYKNEEALNALPVFFRTASGNRPSDEELDKLIAFIEERKYG